MFKEVVYPFSLDCLLIVSVAPICENSLISADFDTTFQSVVSTGTTRFIAWTDFMAMII